MVNCFLVFDLEGELVENCVVLDDAMTIAKRRKVAVEKMIKSII